MDTKPTGESPINRRARATTLKRGDKMIQAVVNKLVAPNTQSTTGNRANIPTQHEMSPLIRDTIQKINDADNVFDVLPDLQLVADIAISGILSSKDLITTTLNFDIEGDDLSLELKDEIVSCIRKYFTKDFKIQTHLYDILYDVLFRTGSSPMAIIPESSVDKLINSTETSKVSLESFGEELNKQFAYKGLLGSANQDPDTLKLGVGIEALMVSNKGLPSTSDMTINIWEKHSDKFGTIHLTDNPDMVKIPALRNKYALNKVSQAYNVAVEGVDNDVRYIDKDYYKNPLYTARDIAQIDRPEEVGRPSVGHPLVMKLPSESVIPIHVPGDFKMHVGYIVMLDNMGNPISKTDLANSSVAWNWINGDAASNLMRDAAEGMGVGNFSDRAEDWTVARLTNSYAELVEAKLINSIKNGVYGDSVTVTRPQEVYRIMMARSLAKMNTQMLYIPAEQLTYFAFDYNDHGIGRSLLDRNRVISTVRSALTFATMQASVLNATRNTQYNIVLDPDDREPKKTIVDAQHEIMRTYNGRVPFNGTPDDILAYISNAGISFNIEGNEYYPSTKVEAEETSPNYPVPDRDIDEEFAKRQYRSLGVDPDLVMSPDNIEFASQVVSKNLLTAKRICKDQEKFAPLITHFVKTYIVSSGPLLKELSDIIKTVEPEKSKQQGVIGKYINTALGGMQISLPPPDTSMLNSQMEAFEEYTDALDKMIEVWINEDALEGIDVDVREAQSAIKAYMQRQWLRRNDVEPDLIAVFDNKDTRQEMIQAFANDNVELATVIGQAMKRLQKRMETVNNNLDMPEQEEDSGGGYDESSDADGDGDGMGGDDEFGGGDDEFGSADTDGGLDDDLGGDDAGESDGDSDGEGLEEEEPEQEEEQEEEEPKEDEL